MFHELSTATAKMGFLPGVLGPHALRRTVQVRLGPESLWLPGCKPLCIALAALRSVPQAGSQLHCLATAIHETCGLRHKA
jgi:hypothetical protein